ncbi:MAG: DUF4209 domain-containing protein [Candidatus Limiplasma sp.]|nr:DUF4209 domain-containing protein [Candidatus Limiplasma sp.]
MNDDIKRALSEIFSGKIEYNHTYVAKLRDLADAATSAEDQKLYQMFQNAMSLYLKAEEREKPFIPAIQWTDGSRSYSIEDFTDDELAMLRDTCSDDLPLVLLARIADVIWTREKNYLFGEKAIDTYMQLATVTFDPEHWVDCRDYAQRAASIAKSLGLRNGASNKCFEGIEKMITQLNGNDPLFLSMSLIELIFEIRDTKSIQYSNYLAIIDRIISSEAPVLHTSRRTEDAFALKTRLLMKQGEQAKINANYREFALYHEACAAISANGNQFFQAIHDYERALLLYRKIKAKDDELRIQRLLAPLKQKMKDNMKSFESRIDISDLYKHIQESLNALPFDKQVISLALNTKICSMQELKDEVLKADSVTSRLFPTSLVDEEGRHIITIPPLTSDGAESNQSILNLHIYRRMCMMLQFYGLIASMYFDYIRSSHDIKAVDLSFLVDECVLIPDDRKEICKAGVKAVLDGQYYEAVHLLVPQIENMYRSIAKLCGGLVNTFEDDSTEQAKTLKSVFEIPELVDVYDENILFTLKGLLTEKAGVNLRNLVAHGLVSSEEARSPAVVYFFAVFIKLCTFYSLKCLHIYKEMGYTTTTLIEEEIGG